MSKILYTAFLAALIISSAFAQEQKNETGFVLFSPWLSGGFGFGWLETSAILNNGAPNPQINRYTGTAQFGGGVDIRTPIQLLFPISLRLELRDYYAVNTANYGGFVIHF